MTPLSEPFEDSAAAGSDPLDVVWKALANRDRRRILDMLREAEQRGEGGVPTGEIALALGEVSRYAVMQHLRVLERANLVVTHKRGRMVLNHLNAVPIRQIYERWVSEFEGAWAGTLTDLKRRMEGPAKRPGGRRERGVAGADRMRAIAARAAGEDSN